MEEKSYEQIALIGAGVIGSGWTIRCLVNGLRVVLTDPSTDAQSVVTQTIETAWPVLEEAGLAKQGDPTNFRFVDTIQEAVEGSDFVQENVPERERLKIDVHEEIDRYADKGVVIASSSSGLLPSRLQDRCKYPDRIVIGHPFAPVYLLPLVEIVGGDKTSPETIQKAGAFYRKLGMRPLHVRREIEAYIADRLQESLYREALHLINDGIATVAEIDAAVTGGPGLRWAFMGTFMGWHLGGGVGGMRHTIDQFGPALELPWSHMKAPKLTEELKNRIVEGCEIEAGDRSFTELEKRRDRCLVGIQQVLAEHWYPQEQDGWPEME